jgi:hypothetical protein
VLVFKANYKNKLQLHYDDFDGNLNNFSLACGFYYLQRRAFE